MHQKTNMVSQRRITIILIIYTDVRKVLYYISYKNEIHHRGGANFYRRAIFSIQSQKQLKCSPGKFCYLSRSAFAPSFYTFYGITEAQNFENHVKSKTAYLHTDKVDLLVWYPIHLTDHSLTTTQIYPWDESYPVHSLRKLFYHNAWYCGNRIELAVM